jgi:uncharacterized membrane protein YbhN (UPF0104 family)
VSTPAPALPFAWLRTALRGVVLAMLGGTGAFFFTVRADTWERLADARWGLLAFVPLMVALAWACNGTRTWLLAPVVARPVRWREALGVTLSVEFALAATPGGIGGVPVRVALSRRLGIPPEASLAIVAADVAADVVFFSILWPFAAVSVLALLVRSGLWARMTGAWEAAEPLHWLLAAAATGVCAGAVTWALWRRRRPGGWMDRAGAAARSTAGRIARFWRMGKARFAASVAVAAVQWTCRYGVLPLTFHALGVDVPVLPLMLLQGCLFLISLLVVVPGGGGSVELLSGAVLPLFAPVAMVGPAILIWRVATYHLYVLAGGVALWRQLRRGGIAGGEVEAMAADRAGGGT